MSRVLDCILNRMRMAMRRTFSLFRMLSKHATCLLREGSSPKITMYHRQSPAILASNLDPHQPSWQNHGWFVTLRAICKFAKPLFLKAF